MDAEISETIVEINDLHKLNPNFGELEQTKKYPGKSTTCVCSPTLASVERMAGMDRRAVRRCFVPARSPRRDDPGSLKEHAP